MTQWTPGPYYEAPWNHLHRVCDGTTTIACAITTEHEADVLAERLNAAHAKAAQATRGAIAASLDKEIGRAPLKWLADIAARIRDGELG